MQVYMQLNSFIFIIVSRISIITWWQVCTDFACNVEFVLKKWELILAKTEVTQSYGPNKMPHAELIVIIARII